MYFTILPHLDFNLDLNLQNMQKNNNFYHYFIEYFNIFIMSDVVIVTFKLQH